MTQHEQGLVAENAALREQLEALKAGRCLHEISEPAVNQQLTNAQIDEVFSCLPEGAMGFLKSWGYRQFARKLMSLYAATVQAAPAAVAVPDEAQIKALMRKHRIWIEHSTLFEDDEPPRELRAVQAEQHQFESFVQDLIALAATPAADASVNVWQQAVDAELASAHLGIAGNVTFMDAAKALNELICWHIEVATNPATNGGKALAQATGGQAQAVDIAELVEGMSVSVDVSACDDDAGNRYFGTVCIAQEDPHGKHGLTLLVQDAKPNFTPQAQSDARDAAFEAARKKFCKLQRYSFFLDDKGNARRVPQFSGNWVEFESVHTLFDPASVDAAIAAAKGE